MNTEVAVNRVGIINTPNQPMYKRFSVDVTHSQKRPQRVALSRLSKVAVIVLKLKKNNAVIYEDSLVGIESALASGANLIKIKNRNDLNLNQILKAIKILLLLMLSKIFLLLPSRSRK